MSYELNLLLTFAVTAVCVGIGMSSVLSNSAHILKDEKITFGEYIGIILAIPYMIFFGGMGIAAFFMEFFNEHGVLTPELSSATLISGFFFAIVGVPSLCCICFIIQVLSRKRKARRTVDEWEAAYLEGRREEE